MSHASRGARISGRLRATAALAAGATLILAATAWGHASLVRSRPTPNARLTHAPARVQAWFTEELDTKGSRLTVWNNQEEQVDRGDSKVSLDDRTLMEVGLKPLTPGLYTVKWRAMADDDREVTQGEFTFRVTAGR